MPKSEEKSFFQINQIPFGSSDLFSQKITLSRAASDDVNAMVTAHEYAHKLLAISTSAGVVSMWCSYLSTHFPSQKEQYYQCYTYLFENSQISHETFAVFFSLCQFADGRKIEDCLGLLDGYNEYQDYYYLAQKFNPCTLGFEINQLVILSCLIYCFQSMSVIKKMVNSFDIFNIEQISKYDLPDSRLAFLIENLEKEELKKYLEDVTADLEDPQMQILLKSVYNGKIDKNGQPVALGDELRKNISSSVFLFLEKKFKDILGTSVGEEEISFLRTNLENLGNAKYSRAGQDPPFKIKAGKSNDETKLISILEEEIIELYQHPIKCVILDPSLLPEKDIPELLSICEIDKHILIQTLSVDILLKNYIFISNEHQNWLQKQKEITCCRRHIIQEENTVYLIPFKDAQGLDNFLGYKNEEVVVYGTIRVSTLDNRSWASNWSPVFEKWFNRFYYLCDVSIIEFLEYFAKDTTEIRYNYISLAELKIPIDCVFFEIIENGDIVMNVIMPSSVALGRSIDVYLNLNYPKLICDEDIYIRHIVYIVRILGTLYFQERIWELNE